MFILEDSKCMLTMVTENEQISSIKLNEEIAAII